MNLDDLHLCEGLLSVFMRGNNEKQTITYRKRVDRSFDDRSSLIGSSLHANVMLDLGSCK